MPGSGQLTINKRAGEDYLQFNPSYLTATKAPLEALGLENDYDILRSTSKAAGLPVRPDAIKLGVARALCELDSRKSEAPEKLKAT